MSTLSVSLRATEASKRGSSAFTLIELLVVIAIVAILAAFLFPVFAQAKDAAKKSVDLSNLKQTNRGTIMYLSDNEDRYPLATPTDADGTNLWGYWLDLPWDLRSGQDALYYEWSRATWGNSIQPYVKSVDLLRALNQRIVFWNGWNDQAAQWVKTPGASSYSMNGLLEGYSSAAIARPGQLIAFSAPMGGTAIKGGYFTQPYLFCNEPNKPCTYVPTKAGCDGSVRNGEWSGTWRWPDIGLNLRPSFTNGSNFAYADGSAKFRRMGANVNGKTDFRTDPYTQYDRSGNAALSWFDDSYCHPLLFRPDFEFENYGAPYEGA